MANNEKLNDEAKTYVVTSLAAFDTPSTVASNVKAEFNLAVTKQAIEAYDPNKRAGRNLAPKWRKLFEEAREAFLRGTAEIGVSHKAVRLRMLDRMAGLAEARGNYVLAAALLEQAAKEMGEAYTNRHKLELAGKDGGPIETKDVTAREIIERRIAELAARGAAQGDPGKPQ